MAANRPTYAENFELPMPDRGIDFSYMSRLVDAIGTFLRGCVRRDSANAGVLLLSPAGKVYNITVDDLGVVTSTYVSG